MNVLTEIREQYETFSETNKQIAMVILRNPGETVQLTAQEIGEKSKTSSASVVRFSKKMGFRGLDELKIKIAQSESIGKSVVIDPIISKNDSVQEMSKKITHLVGTTAADLHQIISFTELEKAIVALQEAKMIYIFGVGTSSLIAHDLSYKFNRSQKPAMYELDSHYAVAMSAHITHNDAFLAISYSGQTKEVLITAQKAKENGSKVIAITRDVNSPLSEIADIILRVPKNEHLVRVAAMSSKYATMMVADILFLGTIQNEFDQVEKMMIETSHLTNQLK